VIFSPSIQNTVAKALKNGTFEYENDKDNDYLIDVRNCEKIIELIMQ
jgi:hypothetical protein